MTGDTNGDGIPYWTGGIAGDPARLSAEKDATVSLQLGFKGDGPYTLSTFGWSGDGTSG